MSLEITYKNNTNRGVKAGKWVSLVSSAGGSAFSLYKGVRLGQTLSGIGLAGLSVSALIPIGIGTGVCLIGSWGFKKLKQKYFESDKIDPIEIK